MLYAAALGLWCIVAILGSNDAAAHMICTSVTLCYVAAGRRPHLRPAMESSMCRDAAGDWSADAGALALWQYLLCRDGVV